MIVERIINAIDGDEQDFNLCICLVFVGGYIKGRFTQKDVDQKSVRYIIPSDMEVTADSFEFQLTDPAGNIILPEVYVICFLCLCSGTMYNSAVHKMMGIVL